MNVQLLRDVEVDGVEELPKLDSAVFATLVIHLRVAHAVSATVVTRVIFPPSRARLATHPSATGTLPTTMTNRDRRRRKMSEANRVNDNAAIKPTRRSIKILTTGYLHMIY